MWVVQRQAVHIHPHIALLVVLTSLISMAYVFLLVGVGFNFEKDGRLVFVSEAFEAYCGWSGVVLGSTGAVEALVQLLASVHMGSSVVGSASTIVQFVTWNVIIGVCDTGWALHYVALVFFFFSSCLFHWTASKSTQYGGLLYQQANALSIVVVIIFGCLFLANGVGKFSDTLKKSFISVEVTIEFILLFLMLLQHCCLAYGIARCTRMVVVFEDLVRVTAAMDYAPAAAHA